MRIPQEKIEEISQKADIVDIVGEYVSLKPRGDRYWGLSPFKPEKTPSFTVSPDKGLWYCFATSQGGSVYQFIMAMENMSFPEALQYLAEKTGVQLDDSGEPDDLSNRRRALGELYNRVGGSFRYIYEESGSAEPARHYIQSRGIDEATSESFAIGFAPTDRRWLYRFLRKKDYSKEFLAESGLFSKRYPEVALFSNRIMFPIRDRRGNVIAFGGRSIDDHGPKYINSPEHLLFRKREHLFGIDLAVAAIRKDGVVHIVEGYMDVVSCHQAGVATAVAPLGTAFTPEQARTIARYAQRIVLVFDPDDAGRTAARKATVTIENQQLEGSVVTLPEGQDPADILREGGADALNERLSEETDALSFLIEDSGKRHRTADLVLKEVFPYISAISSEVRREQSLHKLADTLGVDAYAVRRDYDRAGRTPSKSRGQAPEERTFSSTTDLFLMLATLVNREHFSFVRRIVQPEDLEDANARSLWIALEEAYRRSAETIDAVVSRLDNDEFRTEVLRRISSEEFTQNAEQIIHDATYTVRQRSIRKSIERIDSQLRQLGAKDPESTQREKELLEEKMFLNGELQKIKGYGV